MIHLFAYPATFLIGTFAGFRILMWVLQFTIREIGQSDPYAAEQLQMLLDRITRIRKQ